MTNLISHWAAVRQCNHGPVSSRVLAKLDISQELLFEAIKDISVKIETSYMMPQWLDCEGTEVSEPKA